MNIQVFPPKLTPIKMPPIYIYIGLERQTFMMEGGVSITLCAKTSCAKTAAPKRHITVWRANYNRKGFYDPFNYPQDVEFCWVYSMRFDRFTFWTNVSALVNEPLGLGTSFSKKADTILKRGTCGHITVRELPTIQYSQGRRPTSTSPFRCKSTCSHPCRDGMLVQLSSRRSNAVHDQRSGEPQAERLRHQYLLGRSRGFNIHEDRTSDKRLSPINGVLQTSAASEFIKQGFGYRFIDHRIVRDRLVKQLIRSEQTD
ncbi:hypothetical protein RF11_09962 [Thelohanellus kitauei]|uniref:Uncharacterized protein n=1 Tax=Thelohanellus kitauei TaxID=669202 RepID=A0A0C2J0A9_THEKT|nr:hypothetical protein RF11_09962 [Thelohanellus kitauei]